MKKSKKGCSVGGWRLPAVDGGHGEKMNGARRVDQGPLGVHAPYGGRWYNGEFYAFTEPDAKLTEKQVKGFEKWLVAEAEKKGKWTGRKIKRPE